MTAFIAMYNVFAAFATCLGVQQDEILYSAVNATLSSAIKTGICIGPAAWIRAVKKKDT